MHGIPCVDHLDVVVCTFMCAFQYTVSMKRLKTLLHQTNDATITCHLHSLTYRFVVGHNNMSISCSNYTGGNKRDYPFKDLAKGKRLFLDNDVVYFVSGGKKWSRRLANTITLLRWHCFE